MIDADQIVYLNGEFLPLGEAKVSVLDRGFIYGDGVYELIPVYGARAVPPAAPPRAAAAQPRRHRPRQSAHATRSGRRWCATWSRASRSPTRASTSRSRAASAKRDHAFPKDVPPTVFMMSNPLPTPSREQVEHGVAVVTAEDNRWHRCDLKTISLLGNVLMRQLAADAGRGRDGDVPRRLPHRGLGVERAGRERRHDRRAAEGQPDPAGHHLRRDDGVRARGRHAARRAAGAARPRRSPPTRCGCRRRPRKCSRSRRSTASRSPAASPDRCSAGCGRSSRRTSRTAH